MTHSTAQIHRARGGLYLGLDSSFFNDCFWVAQQARNLGLDFSVQGVRFLIRDRDSK